MKIKMLNTLFYFDVAADDVKNSENSENNENIENNNPNNPNHHNNPNNPNNHNNHNNPNNPNNPIDKMSIHNLNREVILISKIKTMIESSKRTNQLNKPIPLTPELHLLKIRSAERSSDIIELQNKSNNNSTNYLINNEINIINNSNINTFFNKSDLSNLNFVENRSYSNSEANSKQVSIQEKKPKQDTNEYRINIKNIVDDSHISYSNSINKGLPVLNENISEDKSKKKGVKKNKHYLPNLHNSNANPKGNSHHHGLSHEVKRKIFDAIDKYQNQSQGMLEGSFFDAFRIRFCCCKQRYRILKQLYQQGEEELSKYIDYLDMIKTLQQNLKMKNTIFNSHQKDIFDYSFKPRIIFNPKTFEKEVISDTIIEKQKRKREYFNTLYESYKRLQNKEKLSNIDERLINMFDDDIKLPFKIMINEENN